MEEIDFEQLKVVLEGQNDIEIISKIKKPIQVRIQDKHYRVTGIKKRDLLEYFDNVPDQDQQESTPMPGVQVFREESTKEEILPQASCPVPEGDQPDRVYVQPPAPECKEEREGVQVDSGGVQNLL